MTLIKTIAPSESSGKLETLYNRVKGPDGRVDNILVSHSLRPHTLEGHMAIYKAVLHHSGNQLPKWLLETIGTYVSLLNECAYCVDHHFAGLKRLLADGAKADAIRQALELALRGGQVVCEVLTGKELAALGYAAKLTKSPRNIVEADIDALRSAGFDDGEILEINQVTAYFAYANRTVLGLGCSTKGDAIGLSPNNSKNADDWGHQ